MSTSPAVSSSLNVSHGTNRAASTQPRTLSDNLAPAVLDTIPTLASILSRVQPPTSSKGVLPDREKSVSGASPVPASSFGTSSFTSQSSSSQLRPDATGPLSTKEIPPATDAIKYRLQRARVEIGQLPGIEMSIDEQEQMIKALEDRITEQRSALKQLRELGDRAKSTVDSVMEGYEDGEK